MALTIIFTEQQLGWTENGKPVWTVAKPDEMGIKQDLKAEKDIEIPYDLANTQEANIKSESDKVVINVQDAHSSLAAQYSIAGLLDSLVTNYDLSLIAIEGSTGHIDTSILKTIPDEDIRKNTAAFFMAEGKISAGTFFQATSDKDIALYGIENDDLYKKNVESFKALAEARAVQSANLVALLEQLSAIEDKCSTEDLKKLNKLAASHRSGEKSFKDYWKEASGIAEANKIDISGKKELLKLVGSMRLEDNIDFTKANDERKQLIDRLSGMLEKAELEKMVLRSVAFKQNKISQAAYHKHLTDLAAKNGVAGEEYPNLTMFTEYVTLYESVDILGLYREVEGFEEELRTKLYRNDWEKELNYTIKMARLLKQLYEMELTNGEYNFLELEKSKISAEKWSGFIKDACLKNNVEITGGYDLGAIFGGVEEAMGFYRDAEARNGALLNNTLERMKSEGKNVAALITGGYHTEGLTGLMKNKGLSYLIVVPKFEGTQERPYIAVLTGKKSQYEKILETGKYELAVSDMFDNFTPDFLRSDRVAALNIIKPVVFYQLGQVALGDKDIAEFKAAYGKNYRNYYGLKVSTHDAPVLTPDEFDAFIEQIEVRKINTTAVIFDGSETNVPFVTMVRKGVETGGAVKYEFRVTSSAERRAFVARMEALRGGKPGAVMPEDFAEALKALQNEVKEVQDIKADLKDITARLGTSINNMNDSDDTIYLLPEKKAYVDQAAQKLLNDGKYASPENIRKYLNGVRGIQIPETLSKDISARLETYCEKVRERQFELIMASRVYQKEAFIKSSEVIERILGAELTVKGFGNPMKLEDVLISLKNEVDGLPDKVEDAPALVEKFTRIKNMTLAIVKAMTGDTYALFEGDAISVFAGVVLKRTLNRSYIESATDEFVTDYDVPNTGTVLSVNADIAASDIADGSPDITEIEAQIKDIKKAMAKFENIIKGFYGVIADVKTVRGARSFAEGEYRFKPEGKGQEVDPVKVYFDFGLRHREVSPVAAIGEDLFPEGKARPELHVESMPMPVIKAPLPEATTKKRTFSRLFGAFTSRLARILRSVRQALPAKFRTDITFEELVKSSPDLEEMLIKEKGSIKSPDGKPIDIDAGKLAIQADGARNLADGNMYQMPMGFGKTLTFRLAAYLLTRNIGKNNYTAKNNKGVLISTSTNDLAMRDAESAGKILSGFGVSVGFVGGKDDQGRNIGKIFDAAKGTLVDATDDEVYAKADVIYGTIDTFVHRYEAEEMEYDKAKIVFSKRQYFSMFDEADLALIYQLMTPFILSGGDKADAEKIRQKYIKAQSLAEKFDKPGELIDISQEKAKSITLTAKGMEALKLGLNQDPHFSDGTDMNNGDYMAWKALIEQALAAKRCYAVGTDYMINDKKEIVMIGDVQEEVMPGRRWSFGLHAAIEAKHQADGVAVSTEHVTKNATMLRTFLANKKLISDFSGASGTMDLEFMRSVHGKKVVVPAIPELYVSKGEDYVHLHTTASEKEKELLEDIAKTYGEIDGGRPILIKVREGASADLVEKLVARLGAGVRDKIKEYTALSDIALKNIEAGSGKTGSITIVSNRAHRGVDIQLEEIVANNGGMVAYSTYMDEVEATDFQYRRRVARKIGEQGTWKGFWSLEDEVFSKHKKDASVVAAMDALKMELKRNGTPIVSRFGDKKDVVTNLVAAVRRAIMASKIQQFGAESRFEAEIEARKRQFLVARNAVLDGRFNDVELNDLVKDIGLIERYVAPDKKRVFRVKLLEKLDDAFSNYYLDKVGEVKHAIAGAIQDAKGLAVAARAEERKYLHFMGASEEAFRLAAAHVNTWISLEVIGMDKPLEELLKAELAPTKKDMGRRIMGFAFGGAIAAGLWYMMSLFMQAANVMSVLTAGGGAGKVMADKVIFGSTAQQVMSVLPNEAWLVLAPVMILLGLSLYRSQVNKFSEIYKDKENIGLVFKGIATPAQTMKAAASVFVMGLMMLASFAPIGAIFAMISGVAFLQAAPVLIPVAAMIAGSGVVSSLILTFLKSMLLRSTNSVASREVKVTGMQRFFSGLNTGLAYLAGFSLMFIFSSSLSGLLMGSGLMVLAGVGARALERIQYDRTIENTKAAMKTRLAGMTASGALFLVLLAVAKLAGTSQNFMMAVSGIGAVIMMTFYFYQVYHNVTALFKNKLGGAEKISKGISDFYSDRLEEFRNDLAKVESGATGGFQQDDVTNWVTKDLKYLEDAAAEITAINLRGDITPAEKKRASRQVITMLRKWLLHGDRDFDKQKRDGGRSTFFADLLSDYYSDPALNVNGAVARGRALIAESIRTRIGTLETEMNKFSRGHFRPGLLTFVLGAVLVLNAVFMIETYMFLTLMVPGIMLMGTVILFQLFKWYLPVGRMPYFYIYYISKAFYMPLYFVNLNAAARLVWYQIRNRLDNVWPYTEKVLPVGLDRLPQRIYAQQQLRPDKELWHFFSEKWDKFYLYMRHSGFRQLWTYGFAFFTILYLCFLMPAYYAKKYFGLSAVKAAPVADAFRTLITGQDMSAVQAASGGTSGLLAQIAQNHLPLVILGGAVLFALVLVLVNKRFSGERTRRHSKIEGDPDSPVVITISGPSGVGKGTVIDGHPGKGIKGIFERYPNAKRVPSYTTRNIRPTEKDGREHYFIDRATFERMRDEGKFLQWIEFGGNFYGVSRDTIDEVLADGNDALIDLDAAGAAEVRKNYPDRIVDLFISPIATDKLEEGDTAGTLSKESENAVRAVLIYRILTRTFPDNRYIPDQEVIEKALNETGDLPEVIRPLIDDNIRGRLDSVINETKKFGEFSIVMSNVFWDQAAIIDRLISEIKAKKAGIKERNTKRAAFRARIIRRLIGLLAGLGVFFAASVAIGGWDRAPVKKTVDLSIKTLNAEVLRGSTVPFFGSGMLTGILMVVILIAVYKLTKKVLLMRKAPAKDEPKEIKMAPEFERSLAALTEEQIKNNPVVLVFSGPSGVGKRGMLNRFAETHPNAVRVVSYTTRAPKKGEVEGREHKFISESSFKRMSENDEFFHTVKFGDMKYGIVKGEIDDAINSGKDVIVDIDVEGARLVREAYPGNIVDVYVSPIAIDRLTRRMPETGRIEPASLEEATRVLKERLVREAYGSAKPDEAVIASNRAIQERMSRGIRELRRWKDFHYLVANIDGNEDAAVNEVSEYYRREKITRSLKEFNFGVDPRGPPDHNLADFVSMRVKQVYDSGVMPYPYDPETIQLDMGNGAKTLMTYIPGRGQYKPARPTKMTEEMFRDHQEYTLTQKGARRCWACQLKKFSDYALFKSSFSEDGVPAPRKYVSWINMNATFRDHILLATEEASPQTLNRDKLVDSLTFAENLGPEFEGFFNTRPHGSVGHFHAHYYRKSSSIWEGLDAEDGAAGKIKKKNIQEIGDVEVSELDSWNGGVLLTGRSKTQIASILSYWIDELNESVKPYITSFRVRGDGKYEVFFKPVTDNSTITILGTKQSGAVSYHYGNGVCSSPEMWNKIKSDPKGAARDIKRWIKKTTNRSFRPKRPRPDMTLKGREMELAAVGEDKAGIQDAVQARPFEMLRKLAGNPVERLIRRMIRQEKGVSNVVLEFGCGSGEQSNWLVSKGVNCIGVDISARYLVKATEMAKIYGLRTLVTDGGKINKQWIDQAKAVSIKTKKPFVAYSLIQEDGSIPLEDNSVDGVTLHRVYSTLLDDNMKRKVLSEIYRVLKPGGYFSGLDFLKISPEVSEKDEDVKLRNLAISRRYAVHAEVLRRMDERGTLPEYLSADTVMRNFVASADLSRDEDALIILQKRNYSRQEWEFARTKAVVPDVIRDMTYDEFFTEKSYTADQFMVALDSGIVSIQTVVQHLSGPRFAKYVEDSGMEVRERDKFKYLHEGGKGWSAAITLFAEKPKIPRSKFVSGVFRFSEKDLDLIRGRFEGLETGPAIIGAILDELRKGLRDEEDHWFYSRIVRLTGAQDLRQNRDGKKTYYGRVPFVKEDGKRGKLINAATPVYDFDKDDTLDKGETSLSDDSARRLAAMITLGRKVGINTAKALEELRTVKNSLTGETGLELYTPLRSAMIANVSAENWDAPSEDVADDILTDLFDLFLDTSATKLVPKRGARSQYELDIDASFQVGYSSVVCDKINDLLTYHGSYEPYQELKHVLARQREILCDKGYGDFANLPSMNIYAMELPEGHPLRAKFGPRVITKLLYRPFGYKPQPEKKTPEYAAVLEARKEVEKVLVKLFNGMHIRNELGDISIIPVVAGKNAIDLNMVQVLERTMFPDAMIYEPFVPFEIGTYERIQKDRAIEHQAMAGYVDITYHDNEALAGNGLAVTQRLMQKPIPGIDLKVVAADLNKPEELAKATIVAERYIGGGMHGKAAYREADILYADLARGGMAPDKIEGLYYLGGEFTEIGKYLDRAIEHMSEGREGPASAVHPFMSLGAFVHAAAGIMAYILLVLGAMAAEDGDLVNIALWGGIPVFVIPAIFHAYAAIAVFAKMWEHDREFSGGKVRWMTHFKDALVTPIMTSKLKLTEEQISDLVGNSKDRAEKVNILRTAAARRAYRGQPAEEGTTPLLSEDQIFALVDMTNTHNSLARSILAHEFAPSFMGMGSLTHIKAMYTMIWDYVKALRLRIELSSEANMRQFMRDRLRTYDQRYGKGFKPVTYWHSVMREARGHYRKYMKDVEIVFDMGKDGSQRFVVPLPVNSNEMPEVRELLVRYLTIVLRNRMEAIGPQYVYLKYDDSVADMVKEAREAMYTEDFLPTIDAINNTYRVVRRKAMGINNEEELQKFISEEYKKLENEYLSGDRGSRGELTKEESDKLKAQAEINLGGYEFQFIRAVTRAERSRMDSIKAKGIKVRRENMAEARDLNLKGLKNIAPGDFVAGVDVGGSDVKLLLYKGKDIIFFKKYNWAPENFTKGSTEHVDTMRDLIYVMELKAILSQRSQPDQELDALEKEIDNVSYRSDVSSAENEAASEAPIGKIRNIIERAGKNDYIKARLYSASGEKRRILAGVGISWPDIIVDNLIVGGDTAKTKGLTKEEFNEIVTPMADTLKASLGGVPVVIKNDGDVGAFWASVELNRGNVLALALGTSLAGGYVPHSGVLGNLRTYASRMIIDMRKDNEVSYEKFPGTPTGIAALYLSQKNIMILAKEKGLDLGPVKNAGRAQQLKYVQRILNENLPGAGIVREIYDEMGLYMASFLAEISDYYDHRDLIRTVVVTGRCFESPEGNRIMLGNGRDKGRIHRVLNDSYPEIADLEIMLAEELAGNDPSVNAFAQAMGAAYLANQEVTRIRNAEQAQALAGTSVESMVIGVETDSTQAELDKYMASTGLGSVKVLALPKGNKKEENIGILDSYRRQHNLLWAGMADQREIGGRRKLRQAIGALVRQIEINETRLFLKKRAEDIHALSVMTPDTEEEINRAKEAWKEILGEIKLPVIMAEISDLSMYNFNLCDIADKTMTKLDSGTAKYIDDVNKQQGIVEMTVGSLGEARIQAESFRLRNPKKLKLVLTVAMEDSGLSPVDAAALDADIAKLNADKNAILKKMGIDGILRKDDLTIIKRSEHDQAIENSIKQRVEQYGKGNVAVVDMISDTRPERRMPEGAIYMEYNDVATSEVLDATLKLLSVNGDKTKVAIKGLTMKALGYFTFVRKIEAINIEELKNEFKRYQEILIRA